MRSYILIIVFLFNSFSLFCQSSHKHEKLPDKKIENLDGEKVNIQQFSQDSTITVLTFWATWCSPCKKELTNLANLYKYWEEDYDVEIVAISIDDSRNSAKVESYVNGQAWNFTFLLDSNQDLKRALNFQTIPFTLLIDQEGYIVYRHQGYVEGDEYVLEDKIKKLSKQ